MRISGNQAPAAPQVDENGESAGLDAAIEGELLKKNQSQAKLDGEAALSLIDKAVDLGVNKPLTWGPVGRFLNVKA